VLRGGLDQESGLQVEGSRRRCCLFRLIVDIDGGGLTAIGVKECRALGGPEALGHVVDRPPVQLVGLSMR